MATRLCGVVLLVRDAAASARFFRGALGLKAAGDGGGGGDTTDMAIAGVAMGGGGADENPLCVELDAGAGVSISVQQVDPGNEAVLSTGYTPLLTFEVSDMDRKIYELIALGGRLDGAIEYLPTGKVAAMRSPDGHMIGLHETG